jgi:hypothetical protein
LVEFRIAFKGEDERRPSNALERSGVTVSSWLTILGKFDTDWCWLILKKPWGTMARNAWLGKGSESGNEATRD